MPVYDADGATGRPHDEAFFVAYTKVYLLDREWSFTVREGMTPADVTTAIDLLISASQQLGNAEREHRSMPVSEGHDAPNAAFDPTEQAQPQRRQDGPQPRADATTPNGSRARPDSGTERIVRLEIAGLVDDPQVKMWSHNTKLKFPFMTPKSFIVLDLLKRAHPDMDMDSESVQRLNRPGHVLNVTWDVEWVKSPKDDRWKDITGIIIVPKDSGY